MGGGAPCCGGNDRRRATRARGRVRRDRTERRGRRRFEARGAASGGSDQGGAGSLGEQLEQLKRGRRAQSAQVKRAREGPIRPRWPSHLVPGEMVRPITVWSRGKRWPGTPFLLAFLARLARAVNADRSTRAGNSPSWCTRYSALSRARAVWGLFSGVQKYPDEP